jgi:nucleotide-binding universal stress UspA family protein
MSSIILVPYDGSIESQRVLNAACDLAAASHFVVEALKVRRIPQSLPLTKLPKWLTEEAEASLESAREIGAAKGVAVETHLYFTYNEAAAVVSEAKRTLPQAIFVPVNWPQANWFPRLLPAALRDIMRNAQCPVYMGYFPTVMSVSPKEAVAEAERVLDQSS